jgi:hypothetical protein
MPDESTKRALLVGIDEYQYFDPLTGCVNDVLALAPLLRLHANEDPNFSCRTYISNKTVVNRPTLLEGLDELLAQGADVALLYFAGHGLSVQNDVVLATQDARSANDGVAFSTVLSKAQSSTVPEVIIILDCCYSGAAGGIPQLGINAAALREGLAILTATRSDQTAKETIDARGFFSSFLCGAINGGAADVLGAVTLAGVYAYLSESLGGWAQQPTFKANLKTLRTLRQCKSALSRSELRKLVRLFPSSNYDYPLDKRYEPTEKAYVRELGEILKLLQRGRAARIIEPVGTDHMYYAAIEEKACRLTPLGMHYFELDQQGRL